MAEGEDGERPPSPDDSFWGVSGANVRGVDSDGLDAAVDSLVVEGLVGGLRAIDSRTSRCSASICLSYSAHMLSVMGTSVLWVISDGFKWRQNRLNMRFASVPENVIEAKLFAGRPWRRLHCCCGSLWRQGWRFPKRQTRAPRRLKVERHSQASRVRRERHQTRGIGERQPGLRGGEGWGWRHGRAVERQQGGVCHVFQRGFREAEAGEAVTEIVVRLLALRISGEACCNLVTVGQGDRHLVE